MWHLPILQWIWESIKTIYLAAKWLYEKYIYKFILRLALHLQKVWKFVYTIWDKVYKRVKEVVDLIDKVYDKATGYIDKVKEKVDEVIDKVMKDFMLNDTYVEEYLKGKIDHYYYELLLKFNEFWAGKVEPFFGVARSLQHDLLMFKKKYLDTTARILNRIIQQEKVMEAVKEFKETFAHTTIMDTIHQTETSASYFWEYAPSTGTIPSAVAGLVTGWSPGERGPVVHFSEGATIHYPKEWPSKERPYVIWKDGKKYQMKVPEEGEVDVRLKFKVGPDLCLDPRAPLPGRSTITSDPRELNWDYKITEEAAEKWDLDMMEVCNWVESIFDTLADIERGTKIERPVGWDWTITEKTANYFLYLLWEWIHNTLDGLASVMKKRLNTAIIQSGILTPEERKEIKEQW